MVKQQEHHQALLALKTGVVCLQKEFFLGGGRINKCNQRRMVESLRYKNEKKNPFQNCGCLQTTKINFFPKSLNFLSKLCKRQNTTICFCITILQDITVAEEADPSSNLDKICHQIGWVPSNFISQRKSDSNATQQRLRITISIAKDRRLRVRSAPLH